MKTAQLVTIFFIVPPIDYSRFSAEKFNEFNPVKVEIVDVIFCVA
jgi:hypothetical protein